MPNFKIQKILKKNQVLKKLFTKYLLNNMQIHIYSNRPKGQKIKRAFKPLEIVKRSKIIRR